MYTAELRRAGDALRTASSTLLESLTLTRTKKDEVGDCGDGEGEGDIGNTQITSTDTQRSIRESVHLLFLALGDVSKMVETTALTLTQLDTTAKTGDGGRITSFEECHSIPSKTVDWTSTLQFYSRAFTVAPWVGSTLKAAAGAARQQGNIFEASYWLLRSACTTVPFNAREQLLDLFETLRGKAEGLEAVTGLTQLSIDSHVRRFQVRIV